MHCTSNASAYGQWLCLCELALGISYGIPLKLMDKHIMDKHIRLTLILSVLARDPAIGYAILVSDARQTARDLKNN